MRTHRSIRFTLLASFALASPAAFLGHHVSSGYATIQAATIIDCEGSGRGIQFHTNETRPLASRG
jgi:hypothetical protein